MSTKKFSKMELELLNKLKEAFPNEKIVGNDRSLLKYGKDIDILIPDRKIAIEFNGDLWHSDAFLSMNTPMKSAEEYHLDKLKELEKLGYTLYFVWEYHWITNKNVVIEAIIDNIKNNYKHPIFNLTTGPMNDFYNREDIYDAEEGLKPEYKISSRINEKIDNDKKRAVIDYISTKNSLWKFWMGINHICNASGFKRREIESAVVELVNDNVLRYVGDDCFMLDPVYKTTVAKINRNEDTEYKPTYTNLLILLKQF